MGEAKYGSKWSKEETILAYFWYCQIPFGKIHKTNPIICELADLLGRTPSSVVFKMGNLGHFDPDLRKRNVNGLQNASKTDEEVVLSFMHDWEGLVVQAKNIELKMRTEVASEGIVLEQNVFPEGLTKEQYTKSRINQDFFREAVLTSYRRCCCITGLSIPELLVASHIKPWAKSDPKTERTNPSNGLCLNALHDRAFDQGFITVLPNYTIRVSSKIRKSADADNARWIAQCDQQSIMLPDKFAPDREFLQYHNDVIFVP